MGQATKGKGRTADSRQVMTLTLTVTRAKPRLNLSPRSSVSTGFHLPDHHHVVRRPAHEEDQHNDDGHLERADLGAAEETQAGAAQLVWNTAR